METVRAELGPVLQEAISSRTVSPLTSSSTAALLSEHLTPLASSQVIQESAWLWRDRSTLWLVCAGLGGAAVGFFFGFRIGIVSGR